MPRTAAPHRAAITAVLALCSVVLLASCSDGRDATAPTSTRPSPGAGEAVGSVAAAPTAAIDVDYSPPSNTFVITPCGNNSRPTVQSFTAGRTGDLTQVDIDGPYDLSTGLDVRIVEVDGSGPTTEVIGRGRYDGPAQNPKKELTPVRLSQPAPVVAGRSYAVLSEAAGCTTGTWRQYGVKPGAYDGGTGWVVLAPGAYVPQPLDYRFRTWVS